MSPGLVVALLLFAFAYGAVAVYAFRRPLLGKLALREALRHPGQTLLVVGGLMVGTATITAGFVAADSVAESTIDTFAYRNFGHVDITVTAGGRFFSRDVARQLEESATVRGVTDGVSAGIDVPISAADLDTRQGASRVTLVGFDPAAPEPFGVYTLVAGGGTLGVDLEPDEVLVSRLLAQRLQVQPGHTLRVSLEAAGGARESVLRVAGIARSEGPGAYTLGSVVFAPLETAQRVVGTDEINVVRLSAPGGVRDSLEAGTRAAPIVTDVVASLAVAVSLDVREAKAAEAANAEDFTVFIRAMLVGMSALVAAAGAALIVNLIGMLAEERRPRLGVLRALGLRRRGLVGLAVFEGALYSLAAGVVGVAVGVGAGRIVAARFGRAFAEFTGDDLDFDFFFTLDPATLVAGFAAGTLLTLAAVTLAARAHRENDDHRRDPGPATAGARGHTPEVDTGRGVVLGRIGRRGRYCFRAALSPDGRGNRADPRSRIAGAWPSVDAGARDADRAGAGGLVFREHRRRKRPEEDAGTFFLVFVTAMLTSVFGLTVLASANLQVAEAGVGVLGRASSRLRAVLRPPLAYLTRRPLRTGLTTGVFAVVIGMLALFAVFFVIFQSDYERFGGGYDVRVLSTGSSRIELPASIESNVSGTLELPTRAYVGPLISNDDFSTSERLFVPLYEVPSAIGEDPPVRLEQRSQLFGSDLAVWEAMAGDPSLVVTNFGLPDGEIVLEAPEGPVTFTVVGSQTFGLLDGIFGTSEALAPFVDAPRGATMLVDSRGFRHRAHRSPRRSSGNSSARAWRPTP